MPAPKLSSNASPLSADLAAHGRTRALALKKLHRICQAEVRRLKASYTPGHRQVLPQILGQKLLPGAAALSVGQSYKDFYVAED